jgi:hypothetical protein
VRHSPLPLQPECAVLAARSPAVIGAVPTHVETGGMLLTMEHDPHDGDGEQPRAGRGAARDLERHEARSRSAQAIAETFHVPLDEIVGAPEAGHPRVRNGRVTNPEPIWHIAPFPDQRSRCGLTRQCPSMSEGRPAPRTGSPTERTFPARPAVFLGLSDCAHVQERYRQRQGRRLRRFRVPPRGLRTVPQRYP